MEEGGVLARGLFRQEPYLHLDPRGTEPLGTAGCDGIGICQRCDHPAHSSTENGLGAGRLLSLMVAGLEGRYERGPPRPYSGVRQRQRLGMAAAELGVKGFPDHLIMSQHHGADQRVGVNPTPALPGEIERRLVAFRLVAKDRLAPALSSP